MSSLFVAIVADTDMDRDRHLLQALLARATERCGSASLQEHNDGTFVVTGPAERIPRDLFALPTVAQRAPTRGSC